MAHRLRPRPVSWCARIDKITNTTLEDGLHVLIYALEDGGHASRHYRIPLTISVDYVDQGTWMYGLVKSVTQIIDHRGRRHHRRKIVEHRRPRQGSNVNQHP